MNDALINYCKKYNIPIEIYNSFKAYCIWIMPKIDGRDWQEFHYYIMDRSDVYLKQGSGTLIVQMPQRCGKTQIMGKLLCSYFMGMHPDKAVLYCTNTSARAVEFTKENMYDIMFSDKYKLAFPRVRLKYTLDSNTNTVKNKETRKSATLLDDRFGIVERKGQFNSRGVTAAINGIRAHLLVVDDPFASYADANSETVRQKTIDWYMSDAIGRSEAKTLRILISTRYHSDDIIGTEISNAEKIRDIHPEYQAPEVITFRAEAEQDNEFPYDSRKKGEFLIPEFRDKYLNIKYGDPVTWSCVYQQNPINVNGLLLKLQDLKEYLYNINHDNIYISIDTNMKAEATHGDCAGITVWQYTHPNKYLVKFINEQYNFVELVNCVIMLIDEFPKYSGILIEGRASGDALGDILRTRFARVIITEPYRSKVERFQWCLPEFHAGNVWFPDSYRCPNIMTYKRQLLNFTGGKREKNDLVDSTTIFLNWLRQNIIIHTGNSKSLVSYHNKLGNLTQTALSINSQQRTYFRH